MGSLPTWQIMNHHMKKELVMEGGFLSSLVDAVNALIFDAHLLV